MSDKRKRLYSSMTYEEYMDLQDAPPQKPQLRPSESPLTIPELLLSDDIQQQHPLQIIPEDETVDVYDVPKIPKIKKRNRFQSENIHYTFLSFIEKGIQRKKSKGLIETKERV
ncbi:hypothetical protein pb186bvf_001322 [Paramecium bursaria]